MNHEQTKRRAEYDAYLASQQWRQLRQQVLERDGHACRVCNRTKNLDVHHRTYERFQRESLDDLTTLCRPCHEKFHGGSFDKPKPRTRKVSGSNTQKQQRAVREQKRPAIWRVVVGFEDGSTYTTRQIAALSGESKPTAVLNDLVAEGRLVKVSKRQWRKPYKLAIATTPLRDEDRFRQLPSQLSQSVKTRRAPGQPSALDKFSLRAEQDRKTRSGGRASTG